jgi:hypothetical protein
MQEERPGIAFVALAEPSLPPPRSHGTGLYALDADNDALTFHFTGSNTIDAQDSFSDDAKWIAHLSSDGTTVNLAELTPS